MGAGWTGWGVALAGFAVFGVLAWQVRPDNRESPVWQFDEQIAHQTKEHAATHPEWVKFAVKATEYGGFPVMSALAVVGAALLCIYGQPRLAAIWLVAAMVGSFLNPKAKELIDRPRPDAALRDQSVHESSNSFPSGHGMGSTLGYASLGYAGWRLLSRRWAQILFAVLITATIVIICWTRVYLRAHWCTDVIGGAALGISWLAICVSLIGTRRT